MAKCRGNGVRSSCGRLAGSLNAWRVERKTTRLPKSFSPLRDLRRRTTAACWQHVRLASTRLVHAPLLNLSNRLRPLSTTPTFGERCSNEDARLRPIRLRPVGRRRNWPKSKLADVEIGRSRNWPKSYLAEVEQMVFVLFLLFFFSFFCLSFTFSFSSSSSSSSHSSFCFCSVSVFSPEPCTLNIPLWTPPPLDPPRLGSDRFRPIPLQAKLAQTGSRPVFRRPQDKKTQTGQKKDIWVKVKKDIWDKIKNDKRDKKHGSESAGWRGGGLRVRG